MLGRETGRDDRQRDEPSRGRERLRDGVTFAAALLAAVLFEARRNDDVDLPGPADVRATAALRRVRDRTTPGTTDVVRRTEVSDSPSTTHLPGPARTLAKDRRLRKGAPYAAAILVGLLLAGRRDGGVRAEGTPDMRPSAQDVATTGIDASVEDLSAPSTGEMPMLGVGTHRRADYDECFESVQQALQLGYRHVDTTDRRSAYYAEEAVGDAVARSGVDREDVFVATKVTPADLDHDHVRISAEESLDRLGMDYVDLLYVHWPTHDYEPHDTLDAFARLREEGLIDRIGVSNFTVDLLDEALEAADAPIFANQVEMHPLLPQTELREFCERVGVEIVAYSPIARGDVEDVAELQEVAAKHGATPEQVSLAWLREKGVAAIPRATTEAHLRENWRSLALDLDDEDVAKLDSIEERRRIVDPEDAPWN